MPDPGAARTRLGLALSGALLLAVGVVAVFVSDNGAGTAALVAAGSALVALGAFGDRVESIEGGGVALRLQREAESTLQAAEAADEQGLHDAASELRQRAGRLVEAARALASRYESVRAEQASSWQRTAELQRLVDQARGMARVATSSADVAELFGTGTDGNRVSAIGIMQADAGLADTAALVEAVVRPRSAFEQFHALRAVETAAAAGPPVERAEALRSAVLAALEGGQLGAPDSDRVRLAQRVLAMLPG